MIDRNSKTNVPKLPYLPIDRRILDVYLSNITAMGNANNLVQDLNSDHRVHFLTRLPLDHERFFVVLVSLVDGISNFVDCLTPKPVFKQNSSGTI